MTLDEVIKTLKRFPKDFVFERGFERPHSYRGYYDQLAFEPAENVRASLMLELAERALGGAYEGYKGGIYNMDGDTECWLANYGSCGEELTTYFFEVNGQADEISALKEKLNETEQIIRDTPVLKIDVKVARMRAELEAIEYTKKLVEWDTRARTFLENADG